MVNTIMHDDKLVEDDKDLIIQKLNLVCNELRKTLGRNQKTIESLREENNLLTGVILKNNLVRKIDEERLRKRLEEEYKENMNKLRESLNSPSIQVRLEKATEYLNWR